MDLKVPFSDKDEAKRLGARWNPQRRVWYVPPGVDPRPFARWRSGQATDQPYRIMSREAYLVTAAEQCWRCKQGFQAVAFLMSPGFILDESTEGGGRERIADWAFIEYITRLSPEATRFAQGVQPAYRQGYSRTTESRYWANHCPSCSALQGDFHLYSEPDGAFWLAEPEDAARMQARPLPGDFRADADITLGHDGAWRIPGVRALRPSRGRPFGPPPSPRSPPSPNPILGWLRSLGRGS